MLFLKYLLTWGGIGMIAVAAGILIHDLYLQTRRRLAIEAGQTEALAPESPVRWRASLAFALLARGPILLALGIVVVPSGMAGVRVSQTSGTLAGTLYPGVHFVTPLAESVALFDTRDQLFTTGAVEDGVTPGMPAKKSEPLVVQAKEGSYTGSGHYRPLPPRSPAARLHSGKPAPADRTGNRTVGGRQRLA
jgi:hypothetical protein